MHVSSSWLMPNFLFAHDEKQKCCTTSSGVQPRVLPPTAEGPPEPQNVFGSLMETKLQVSVTVNSPSTFSTSRCRKVDPGSPTDMRLRRLPQPACLTPLHSAASSNPG